MILTPKGCNDSMGAGRKTKTLSLKEKTQHQWSVNCSVSARNLRQDELGAVIFGCKHATFRESINKHLFGLPQAHFSYVKNVTPGLTLFLFNYSDRILHGIFEAASPGKLNINPYGWTDGTELSPYPAQVQVRVRKQCRPLPEEAFAPIIADNYYEPMLFWFELDRTQTSKLMNLFLSSPSPGPRITPPLQNTAEFRALFNALHISDTEVGNGVKGQVSETITNNPDELCSEWDTWEATAANPKPESAYASDLSSESAWHQQKSWVSLFYAPSASGREQKDEMLNALDSKIAPLSGQSNVDCEASWVSSSLQREGPSSEACSDDWVAEVYDEPADVREESGHFKSIASEVYLQHPDELDADWETSYLAQVYDMEKETKSLEAFMDSNAKGRDDDMGVFGNDSGAQTCPAVGEYAAEFEHLVACTATELNSCNFLSVVDQLMREVEELKGSQLKQNLKIDSLEQELGESKLEIQKLRHQYKVLASRPTSSPSGQFEEVDFKAFSPFPLSRDSILVLGGYDGSDWSLDFSLYSPTHDLIKDLIPMTFLRSYSTAAQLNGEVYLFGGVRGDIWYDTVESYDFTHNRWVTQPSLNRKKGSLAGISVFDKLYAIGGGNGVHCFSEVEVFDVNIGKWIFTKSMQEKRFAPAVADINGALYVAGGYDGADYLKSLERFDPREPKWTGLESMSTKRGCHSFIALNEKLYALGGYDGEKMVSTVEIFDPRIGLWMIGEPMKHPRGYSAAVVIGGKLYSLGGMKDLNEVLDTIECYEEGYGWQITNLKALGKKCFFSALTL